MQKIIFLLILLLATTAQADDANLDGQPQSGEHLSQCKSRNQIMEKAAHRLDSFEASTGEASKECFEQIRASVQKCSQDPSVGSRDMHDAEDIGSSMQQSDNSDESGNPKKLNSSSISSQFYATAGVHKMKESKYRSRANACRDEAKAIESVCQKSIDAMNNDDKNNEEGSSGYAALNTAAENPQKIKAFIQSGAKEAIKAIKTAGYCDLISGNDESAAADQDQRYAQSLSTGPQQNTDDPTYHKPLVPPEPNPTEFADGKDAKETDEKSKTRVEKLTGSKALAEVASLTVNALGDTGGVAGSAGRTLYHVADTNYQEAAKSGVSTLVQSAPYAAEYMGWSSARTWLSAATGATVSTVASVGLAVPGAYFGQTVSTSPTESLTGSGYVPLDVNSYNNSPQVAINLMEPKQTN